MPRNAEEIFKNATNNLQKRRSESAEHLKSKCVEAVTEMMRYGHLVTEIDLTDEDRVGLTKVTQEMRDLGYYYCLIETENESGDILGHRLRISIEHLREANG